VEGKKVFLSPLPLLQDLRDRRDGHAEVPGRFGEREAALGREPPRQGHPSRVNKSTGATTSPKTISKPTSSITSPITLERDVRFQ